MESIYHEPNRLSLQQLARREGIHLSTAWRWCLRGIRGHKLESFNIGAKKFTTEGAYARWLAAINGEAITKGVTPRQRERDIDRAERELSKLGI